MALSTMSSMSYGINKPLDLLEKLLADGSKITASAHPHDIFNFLVTAAVLNEWVGKYYPDDLTVKALKDAQAEKDQTKLPAETSTWVSNEEYRPNKECDPRRDVWNATRICWNTANASKHFQWSNASGVSAIEDEPKIKDWYQYFFTPTGPGLFIEYAGEYYSIEQIKEIVILFYSGLLSHVAQSQRRSSSDALI